MMRRAVLLFALLGAPLAALAQQPQQETVPAIVTSIATGVAEGPAAYAEFTLVHRFEDSTAIEALAGARQFGPNVRKSLDLKEFPGVAVDFGQPVIIRYEPPAAEVSAIVRANLNALASDEGAEHSFGRLIDELRRLSEVLDCGVSLPRYLSANEDELIRQAIQDATEKAYTPGDAAAAALRAQVYTVDQVDILGFGFDAPPESLTEWEPVSPGKARCWAKVRVTYLADN